jgi:hypothetical protein
LQQHPPQPLGDGRKEEANYVMITLVYSYYNQPEMLLQHLSYWKHYPQLKKILVDDGSHEPVPNRALEFADVYRINEDIPWHQDQARNLAMSHAEGWCLLLDLDHAVLPNTVEDVLDRLPDLDPGSWYRLPRRTKDTLLEPGQNIFLIHEELFWECGGYPPTANYGSDRYFLRTLEKKGNYAGVLDVAELLVYLPANIADAATKGLDRTVSAVLLNEPIPFTWQKLNHEALRHNPNSGPTNRNETGRTLDATPDTSA